MAFFVKIMPLKAATANFLLKRRKAKVILRPTNPLSERPKAPKELFLLDLACISLQQVANSFSQYLVIVSKGLKGNDLVLLLDQCKVFHHSTQIRPELVDLVQRSYLLLQSLQLQLNLTHSSSEEHCSKVITIKQTHPKHLT